MNSLFIKTINKFIFTATIFCSLIATSVIADDSETRIVVGMRSAKAVIDELEYMVSELAGRVDSYENNIFPNIDIFLIGVDTEKPIRFDPIFSEKHGMELQPIIPILDLDEFLEDNLDPIGIIPERDRRVKDLYELTGTVFEGWLRVLKDPEYVVIFPRKEAIPKGMDHPELFIPMDCPGPSTPTSMAHKLAITKPGIPTETFSSKVNMTTWESPVELGNFSMKPAN